jgi:fumarate hydratase class I
MDDIDIQDLIARGPKDKLEELRLELYEKVNALGIGAQGLGGLTTVLDVKIRSAPTHAASLPVGLMPQCAANRHIHFVLDGSGPAELVPPPLSAWPDIGWRPSSAARHVNLDTLTRDEIADWKPGDRLLLSGKLLTGRDAAHKRIATLLTKGEALPPGVDFTNRVIYYVGPVDAVGDEAVGPAGPTTANRMDKFTDTMLDTGLLAMVGKAERGPVAIESICRHKAAYLIAVGGAAYLVSKAIRSSRLVAFADLGMEAIYEFEVENMPVTVAVDSAGESVHQLGMQIWRRKIGMLPVTA